MPRFARVALAATIAACCAGLAFAGGPPKPGDPPPPPPPPPSPPQWQPATNLGWDRCAGDGRVADRSFACDTDAGSETLVGSVVMGGVAAHDGVAGFTAHLDVTPAAADVPDWWKFQAGGCRANALASSVSSIPPTPGCLPWSSAELALGVQALSYSAGRFQVAIAGAVPAGSTSTFQPGIEYALFRLVLHRVRTTGAGACAGCAVPVCVGFGELWLYRDPSTTEKYAGAGSNSVTWQGAYVAAYPAYPAPPGSGHANVLECTAGPVPVRGRTWGTIKALYR